MTSESLQLLRHEREATPSETREYGFVDVKNGKEYGVIKSIIELNGTRYFYELVSDNGVQVSETIVWNITSEGIQTRAPGDHLDHTARFVSVETDGVGDVRYESGLTEVEGDIDEIYTISRPVRFAVYTP